MSTKIAMLKKIADAVNDVATAHRNAPLPDRPVNTDNSSNTTYNEAVLATAAEGRRLYIGNLAYATNEAESVIAIVIP